MQPSASSGLASRTTNTWRSKSTSLTRRRKPSIKRMPVPYNSLTNNAMLPSIAPKREATSALVNTDGIRRGRVGRCTSVSQGKSIASTSRYKNSKALRA
jgi:hypothetical protein